MKIVPRRGISAFDFRLQPRSRESTPGFRKEKKNLRSIAAMASVPTHSLPWKLLNGVIAARNSDGVHSYYGSGWYLKETTWNPKINLPCDMLPNSSFTVVFKHSGVVTRDKFQLVFGIYNEEDKSRIALRADKSYDCLVTEGRKAKPQLSRNINSITLEGFHVLEYKTNVRALEVFFDGERCILENSLTDRRNEYKIFKGDPETGSPFSIWETHFIMPDIKQNLSKYRYVHHKMRIGIGSYYEFYADWGVIPEIYVEGKLAGEAEGPGEQIVTVRCYMSLCVITSSSAHSRGKAWPIRNAFIPLSTDIDCSRTVNAFYSVTVFFGEIDH